MLDTGQSIIGQPKHPVKFWWKQRYKLVLTILFYVSQQVWWLEGSPSETYPLVDTLSTESKYSSNPSKQ